ncbi:MAG TPA: hypothetical protein VG939_22400 [Caulobacteraceae bacterium]|nr:hypothetical protein [Caulobacteraceae bacterium]
MQARYDSGRPNFASLSVKDLLEARDLFHYHLTSKRNVVGTAIGLYRIRKDDPWPSRETPDEGRHTRLETPRTLFNSEVRPYSWPCVYVFVASWASETQLASQDPTDVVPKTLYLPDGRTVPVCVILAERRRRAEDMQVRLSALGPRNLLEPGSLLVNEDGQGLTRVGTAGALCRDGERYYALTNQHVAGSAGTPIKALQGNRSVAIGATDAKRLTREPLGEIYPNYPSTLERLRIDLGLVVLDDLTQWSTAFRGVAPIGEVLNLYDNDFDLTLIGKRVVGRAGVSGLIEGEIHGLFYRYKAMGGSDYISDFIIGPPAQGVRAPHEGPEPAFNVHHGDSGTVLFILDHAGRAVDGGRQEPIYRPFALLWGKETFVGDARSTHPYALATALSPALDRLDLDLVTDLDADQTYVWGWVGHYAIGRTLQLDAAPLSSAHLKTFVGLNIDLLSVEPDDRLANDPHATIKGTDTAQFVPMADVPDNVWKSNVNLVMSRGPDGKSQRHPGPGSRGQADNPNHFADLDLPYKGFDTFLAYNVQDPHSPQVADWLDYFASHKAQYDAWADAVAKPGKTGSRSNHWGALPFRIGQLFDIMTKAAQDADQDRFIAAGGVAIHYWGDACQPLHTSYLSQGDPDRVVQSASGGAPKLEADGVHSGYEDDLVGYGWQKDDLRGRLAAAIAAQNDDRQEAIAPMNDAAGARRAVIDLIAATHATLEPRAIVDKWVDLKGRPKAARARPSAPGRRRPAAWRRSAPRASPAPRARS